LPPETLYTLFKYDRVRKALRVGGPGLSSALFAIFMLP